MTQAWTTRSSLIGIMILIRCGMYLRGHLLFMYIRHTTRHVDERRRTPHMGPLGWGLPTGQDGQR
jgi:hypothetical protein